MSDGATGKFGYARGMPEGQGKFSIAAEAPPAISPERSERAGASIKKHRDRLIQENTEVERS
jgi:hypothetical protein